MEKKQNWYVNKKKYHYIYKTTCNVNDKYYIGMHSTDKLNDGYIGSGTRLWHSIKKHGRENFSIEILEFLPDREALKKREAELVNKTLLLDAQCMNLSLGGEGTWNNYNTSQNFSTPWWNSEIQRKNSLKQKEKIRTDQSVRQNFIESSRKSITIRPTFTFANKRHSEESKNKIGINSSMCQSGNKNSQYGSYWVYSEELQLSKKVKGEVPQGWNRGRKIKW